MNGAMLLHPSRQHAVAAVRCILASGLLAALLGLVQTSRAATPPAPAAHALQPKVGQADTTATGAENGQAMTRILAVVNNSVITDVDVDNRRRLFALSTGLPISKDILDRLTPQVLQQLIDERLRLQEAQRRKIAVSDAQVAEAIASIEKDNNMPHGTLRRRLESNGVAMSTLISQLRAQLAWSRVLRMKMTEQGRITPAMVEAEEAAIKAQTGKPEYHVAEIFIPVEDQSKVEEARRFADTVIEQLRKGAPFAVVAAQFSQGQSALRGGDIGWVQPNQLDPEVARVVAEMPPGAISRAIRVSGGFIIATLKEKRIIGNDPATLIKMAVVTLPFTSPLDPSNPTDQQKEQLQRAKKLGEVAHSCDQLLEAAKGMGLPTQPPQVIRLENVNPPQLRTMLANLPDGKASQPLVAPTGITVVLPCERQQRNLGMPSKDEILEQLVMQRIELVSQQLMRDLHRRAVIEIRNQGA